MKYRAPRHPTRLNVTAVIRGYKIQCTVIDVNEFGACLSGIGGIVIGDEVTITCPHGRAVGAIKWIQDIECGVEFTPRIAQAIVHAFRSAGGHSVAAGHFQEMR